MSNPKFLEEFPPVPTAKWEEVIQKDLKGADYAKKLIWHTDEQIAVKPYYRAEDLAGLSNLDAAPGDFPYIRGTHATNACRVRERIEVSSAAEANQQAKAALAAGAEEVEFVLGAKLPSAGDLKKLLDGLKCPVHFEAGGQAKAMLKLLVEERPGIEGSIDYDPLSEQDDPGAAFKLVLAARTALPRFRPITVRGHRFHDTGATATQELGYALAAGVEYLAELTGRGLTVDQAAASFSFSFAAGSIFFFEIAKLRAARLLWARAVEAFGPSSLDAAKARIDVRTSRWNKTIYDAYVNALRGTTEAMSAVIGGCDSLSVAPFNETYSHPGEAGRRLARNTQLILQDESLLDRAVDPAGGAYFVEVLTDSIARESWKLVQETEAAGGFRKAWTGGAIPAAIAKSQAAKKAAVSSRKRTIVGINQYPNLTEHMLDKIETRISPRAAEEFEAIRLRTEKNGRAPVFLLIETGDLKMRKARSNFIANFFGCAGFDIQRGYAEDAAAAAKLTAERKPDAAVLCSADEEYPTVAAVFCQKLRETNQKVPVIVAGYPKDAIPALTEAGVAEFVHVRSNAAEVLSAWQTRLGVKQ